MLLPPQLSGHDYGRIPESMWPVQERGGGVERFESFFLVTLYLPTYLHTKEIA